MFYRIFRAYIKTAHSRFKIISTRSTHFRMYHGALRRKSLIGNRPVNRRSDKSSVGALTAISMVMRKKREEHWLSMKRTREGRGTRPFTIARVCACVRVTRCSIRPRTWTSTGRGSTYNRCRSLRTERWCGRQRLSESL